MGQTTSTADTGASYAPIIADEPYPERRDHIVREIVVTEESYVASLNILYTTFMQPLVEAETAGKAIISSDDIRKIFSITATLFTFHGRLAAQLRQRLDSWSHTQLIGDIFVSHAPMMRMTADYVRNYDSALDTFARCKSQNSAFRKFLDDLCKSTPAAHPDFRNIQEGLQLINDVATFVNERKRDMENTQKILEIQQCLTQELHLLQPHRRFQSNGELSWFQESRPTSTPVQFFLFNDSLLLASPKTALFRRHTEYDVMLFSPLHQLEITDCSTKSLLICRLMFLTHSGSYNLATTSMAEKETWIKDFYWVRANSSNKRIDLTLEKEKEKISKKRELSKKKPKSELEIEAKAREALERESWRRELADKERELAKKEQTLKEKEKTIAQAPKPKKAPEKEIAKTEPPASIPPKKPKESKKETTIKTTNAKKKETKVKQKTKNSSKPSSAKCYCIPRHIALVTATILSFVLAIPPLGLSWYEYELNGQDVTLNIAGAKVTGESWSWSKLSSPHVEEIIVICWGTLGCSAVLLLVSGILSTLATVKVTKMTKRRKYSLIAMDLIVSVFALAQDMGSTCKTGPCSSILGDSWGPCVGWYMAIVVAACACCTTGLACAAKVHTQQKPGVLSWLLGN